VQPTGFQARKKKGKEEDKDRQNPPGRSHDDTRPVCLHCETIVPIRLYRCYLRPEMQAQTVPRVRDIITWHKLTQKNLKNKKGTPLRSMYTYIHVRHIQGKKRLQCPAP